MSRRKDIFWIVAACVLAILPSAVFAQQVPPAEGDEAALIAVLKSDAEAFDKAKACQRLAVIGTKECVPALAELLTDNEFSHYARYGLEPNPNPAAGEALRNALDKVEGGLLIGVINSVGMRRDAGAISKLKGFLGNSDAAVVDAAANSLARICTPESVKILTDALGEAKSQQPVVAAACLTAWRYPIDRRQEGRGEGGFRQGARGGGARAH